MNIGLGIGIPFTRSSLWASIFTPSALFLDGSTQGVWYDPSDINLTWRRNLLTYTEQFDNAAWTKTGVVVTSGQLAPDGSNTAAKVVASAGALYPGQITTTPGNANTFTGGMWVRGDVGGERVKLDVYQSGIVDNLTAEIVLTTAWVFINKAAVATNSANVMGLTIWNTSASSQTVYIWRPQLEVGSTATPYQRITDGIQDYLTYQPLPVLYQDSAGTTPVTVVEQPVGLMLDKSKGLVPGSELITNAADRDFSSDTGWWTKTVAGVSIGSGVCSWNASGGGINRADLCTSNKWYVVKYTITSFISGSAIRFYAKGNQTTLRSSVGTYAEYILCGSTGPEVGWYSTGSSTCSIDNVSIQELPGNHAFNPSGNSANFPVLSARVNLLERTEDFTNAYWSKNAAVAVTQSGVIGTISVPNTIGAGVNIFFRQSLSTVINTTSRIEVRGPVGVSIALADDFGTTVAAFTGDWQTITLNTTGNGGFHQFYIRTVTANQAYSFEIRYPDFRVANDGVNLPAYQRVNTATDYDTVGFKPYLRFNGVNQWLQTNSIDFTYTDKMFVSAGVRRNTANEGLITENSAASWQYAGAFGLGTIAAGGFFTGLSGSVLGGFGTFSKAAPTTDVLTAAYDIASSVRASESKLRVNGSDVAQTFTGNDAGTGNYGNYPLYIGARAGTSLFFNGRLYQLVIAAGSEIRLAEEDSDLFLSESGDFITAETTVAVIQSAIEQTEAFVNRKTSAF